VAVEAGREHRDSALEVPVHRHPRRARVPVVAEVVLEGVAVPRAVDEPTRLVGDRVVRRVRKGPERVVADVGAVRVDVVFRARRRVLQVVLAAVLGHRGALDERLYGIAVILTGARSTGRRWTAFQHLARTGDGREATGRIEPDPGDRIE